VNSQPYRPPNKRKPGWREYLDKYASIYWAARAPHVFAALNQPLESLVLDLGCNTGKWSRELARKKLNVIGVDLDLGALREGNIQNTENWRPQFANASAEALPLSSGKFDAVICLDMLDIVPDDCRAIQEIYRVLKPGGQLIITVLSRLRRHTLTRISFAEHIRNYTYDELSYLLEQNGFVIKGSFTFYRRMGGLAREAGALANQTGLGKIWGINAGVSMLLAGLTRMDGLLPEHSNDGGFGLIACK
jgi:SAM-dependent methyltransferase